MPSELSQCIANEQWERAIALCSSKPSETKAWSSRSGFFEGVKNAEVLPIHEACASERAPLALIVCLVSAYPTSLQVKESAYGRLPIHIACRKNANLQIIRLLMEYNPNGSLEADTLGRLPIHYALSNGASDPVIEMLLEKRPTAAQGMDRRGWLPLHVACSVGASTNVVNLLVKAYPEGTVVRTNKGTSLMRCMDSHQAKNKHEVAQILDYHRRRVNSKLDRVAAPPSEARIIV